MIKLSNQYNQILKTLENKYKSINKLIQIFLDKLSINILIRNGIFKNFLFLEKF